MKEIETPDALYGEIEELIEDAAYNENELGETTLHIDTEVSIDDTDYRIIGSVCGFKIYDRGDDYSPMEVFFTATDADIEAIKLDEDGNEVAFCPTQSEWLIKDYML